MRFVIAMMKHETNTFSPVPTPLARFGTGEGPLFGKAAYQALRGSSSAIGAFIDLAEAEGAEILTPVAADAPPSGPVEDGAYRAMSDAICEAVRGGCDAVLLDLHGAMVTQSLEDGEGALLSRIRGIAPGIPIAVALDMHANVHAAMVDNADVIAGYQTYPHVDIRDTGERAGRALIGMLKGKARPRMAWGQRPMLPHVMRQGTGDLPNRALQARAREMEERGEALCASLFVGFPHADIREAGLSCVVVTDGAPARAAELRDELLDCAWRDREKFVYRIEPLGDLLNRAAKMPDGPIVLLDHYDNCASGGTMDTTVVLRGILDAGLENVAAFGIHDPGAVQELMRAGIGAEVTLPIGGKLDMPAIGRKGEPLDIAGRVKLISDGRYRNRGPAGPGMPHNMGPAVVLDTGKAEIAIISRHVEPNDMNCLLTLGIDPLQKRYLMLKSRIHWRAGFLDIAKAVVECAGAGVCTSDYGQLTFRRVRRPIFPLDLANEDPQARPTAST